MSRTNHAAAVNGLPSLLMQAAQSAAQADGVLNPTSSNGLTAQQQQQQQQNASVLHQARMAVQQQQRKPKSSSKKGPPLRRGKWTPEEEAYAARLIQEFKAGLLPLTDGTTLRTFLSKLLNCDPMRISKKFVGSNCIGKQVFRRRTNDMNRLTPEQIQQNRAELSELERRFLERVAQTNRVKNSGVAAAKVDAAESVPSNALNHFNPLSSSSQAQQQHKQVISNPPWLQPPNGYRHGMGAAMAAGNSRAAAAGRALLNGQQGSVLAELQRQASLSSALQNHPLLAAVSGSSSAALQQLARNASGLSGTNDVGSASMNSLNFLTSTLSRDQLSQLAQTQQRASSNNLNSNRQNSFDALMSLDLQSLQSMDNLASMIQNGGTPSNPNLPQAGLKNADFSPPPQQQQQQQSNGNNDTTAWMQRLASSNGVQSLLRSLSSNMNMNQSSTSNNNTNDSSLPSSSNANFANLLQSMQAAAAQQNGNNPFAAASSSAVSLANLLRQDSSTGLSALRVQDGLNHRNSSVDDFLSLMATGDIPHQDASLLNVPLTTIQNGNDSTAALANGRTPSAVAMAMAQARAAAAGQKRGLEEVVGDVTSQGNAKR